MFTANVYQIMIASPGDVKEERESTKQIILNWNYIHSVERNIVLLPLSWEDNMMPGIGGRPQELVNNKVLKNADLLIGIFGNRLGSSTEKYISGTVEEIEEHIKAGKPAMLYFSDKAISPSQIDREQYEGVRKFQEEYQGKSFYFTFTTNQEFKDLFNKHLSIQLYDPNFEGFENGLYFSTKENTIDKPSLSIEAQRLLIEASRDTSGQIIVVGWKGGRTIQTNNINFTSNVTARIEAQWDDAVEQLVLEGLLKPEGYQGQIYSLTAKGYKVADQLKQESFS